MTDIILEIIRAAVVASIAIPLYLYGKNKAIRQQNGWVCIVVGFGLILLGSIVDITDNFPSLNRFVIIGDTEFQAFLEKVVGYLAGFLFLAFGFWKWLPVVIDLEKAKQALREANDDLDLKVKERTSQLEEEISQREKAQQMIKESNKDLDLIFNTAGVGMRIIDNEFNVIQTNKAFQTLAGLTKHQLVGGKCYHTFSGPHCHTPDCPLVRVKKGEKNFEIEDKKKTVKGREIDCMISVAAYIDSEGKVAGTIESFNDITERKQLEMSLSDSLVESQNFIDELDSKNNELTQAYTELKATQVQMLQREKMASIGQLAAGVAHEINNPMGFIKSNLGSLKSYMGKYIRFIEVQGQALDSLGAEHLVEDTKKELKINFLLEDTNELLAETLEGTERVTEIVQNMKMFSRVDDIELIPANINDCLENTLKIIWNELKYTCTIHKEYGELPLTSCRPQELNQVFMNILINASHSFQEQGEITIRTWEEDGSINISISDTGNGIPADKIERIFEPFFTTKEVGKGTGLGLSICYDIVKKHEGNIEVESEVGKGTKFTVTLPIKEQPETKQSDSC